MDTDTDDDVASLDASDGESFTLTEEEQAYVEGAKRTWEVGIALAYVHGRLSNATTRLPRSQEHLW